MPEENQPEPDMREPWEKLSQIVDPEFKRQGEEWARENHESLAANGFKYFRQEEGNHEVASLEEFGEALRKAHESPIQLDPFEPDEYW